MNQLSVPLIVGTTEEGGKQDEEFDGANWSWQ